MDEELFRTGVLRLRTAGIPFWVDHGTLLGIVREGRVIPWDQDYDFGVWSHLTTERAVVDAFDAGEFQVQSLFARGTRTIHVFPKNKTKGKIDITFYVLQADRAIHRVRVAADSILTRLLSSLARFLDPSCTAKTRSKYWLERFFHRRVLPFVPRFARRELGRGFERLIERNCRNGLAYVYDFPAQHFEQLQSIRFLGVDVDIPRKAEEYLEVAYGPHWRVPRQWTHWYEGASRVEQNGNIAFKHG